MKIGSGTGMMRSSQCQLPWLMEKLVNPKEDTYSKEKVDINKNIYIIKYKTIPFQLGPNPKFLYHTI